jgi:hypothetical protein
MNGFEAYLKELPDDPLLVYATRICRIRRESADQISLRQVQRFEVLGSGDLQFVKLVYATESE